MLTGDVSVHVLDVDAGLLGNQEAQTSGVQVGAGTEDLVLGQTGELLSHVGSDVDRVGDEHVDGVRSTLTRFGMMALRMLTVAPTSSRRD